MAAASPHAVLIAQPAQGHVTPMLQLAKLFHSRGFRVTFVNSEYNHRRLLKAGGAASLDGVPDFHFEAIPDGLPRSEHEDVTQDIAELCVSTARHSVTPFRDLLVRLGGARGVSCVVADGVMSFAQRVAEEMGILGLVFWTTSACGFMGYLHFAELIRRGYTPLKAFYCREFTLYEDHSCKHCPSEEESKASFYKYLDDVSLANLENAMEP